MVFGIEKYRKELLFVMVAVIESGKALKKKRIIFEVVETRIGFKLGKRFRFDL